MPTTARSEPDQCRGNKLGVKGGKLLAVRTSLAAGKRKTFTLKPGAPKATDPKAVVIKETAEAWEITNGLTGVRVPKAVQTLPFPSPVQGVLLGDGTWTATDKARLVVTVPEGAKPRMTVEFLAKGPLKTVVQVRYDFELPAAAQEGKPAAAGEKKFSTTTIAIEAGQPSVLFEEEADLARSYALEMFEAVHPTHARYRGHHSVSKAQGYGPDGQVGFGIHGDKHFDFQVDLTFGAPRIYGQIARWNPWISGCGWYWQMFDDAAGPESSLVGVFAGRASRQYRSTNCGVGGYTVPAGLSDLVSATDAKGAIHAVYVGKGGLWLLSIDAALKPGKPAKFAEGHINPKLALLADGSLSVLAYDPATKQFVELQGRAGAPFTRRPVVLAGAEGVTVGDPYAYQAVRGNTQFLFFYGDRAGKRQGLLFSRGKNETAFTYRDAIDDFGYYWQVGRPCFAALPDGRVLLLATANSGHATVASISPDSLTFSTRPNGLPPVNFGAALDPDTGGFTLVHPADGGQLYDYPPAGDPKVASLKLEIDHHGQGANRRTLAVSPEGTAVLLFGGNLDNAYKQTAYRRTGSVWGVVAVGGDGRARRRLRRVLRESDLRRQP